MKHLLTLTFLTFFFQIQAQDMQWYVLNECYMTTPGLHSTSQVLSNRCAIHGVIHPWRPNPLPYAEPARNDVFIIFKNGKNFNSRYLELDDNNGIGWDDWYMNNEVGMFLNTSSPISHMYFTNVYEGNEEPDAYASYPTTNPFDPNSVFKYNGASVISDDIPPAYALTSNHTPVPGKDVTLIIAHDSLNKECTYDLCYTIDPIKKEKQSQIVNAFVPESIFGTGNNATSFTATGNGNSLIPGSYSFDNSEPNCIKNLQLNTTGAFTYINLRLREDPDSILSNSPINFSLNSPGCETVSLLDTIKNSHDPNYILVECVHKPADNKFSTIQYYVQCMNDGDGNQPNPSIELTFPFAMDKNDVTVNGAAIRESATSQDFNQQSPTVNDVSTNRIIFEFDGNLDHCEPPQESDKCIAWVRFCVKVDSNFVNVLTQDLEPINRNTNFGDDPYIIADYTDIEKVCDTTTSIVIDTLVKDPNEIKNPNKKNRNPNEIKNPNEIISYKIVCNRPITKACDCRPNPYDCSKYTIYCNGNINWTAIGLILLILLLIILTLRQLFKRP